MSKCSLVIVAIWLTTLLVPSAADYGLLLASNNFSTKTMCFTYANNGLNSWQFPDSEESASFLPLVDMTMWDICEDFDPVETEEAQGKAVMVKWQKCSLLEKNSIGVVVLVPVTLEISKELLSDNASIMYNITTAHGMISENSYKSILEMGPEVLVKLYVPKGRAYINFSMLLTWIMAVISVTVGAIYTKDVRNKILNRSSKNHENASQSQTLVMGPTFLNAPIGSACGPKRTALYSICQVMIYATVFIGTVLLIYFFFNSMVYVFIAMFLIAATISVYWIFIPFMHLIPCGNYSCDLHFLKICHITAEIQDIILLLCTMTLSITWCVLRHERYIWVLQNCLGMAVCITFISLNRVETLKSCTMILIAFFIYDILFVFVTPLFTPDGKSVMERIVIGGNEQQSYGPKEQMPTILKVPYYTLNPLGTCFQDSFYVLGFGDIIIPGLLISLCHTFGMKTNAVKIYLPVVLTGYGIGLILTDTFLSIMRTAQPALLYLVPCTLPLVMITSCIRKEFWHFWSGEQVCADGYKYNKVDEMDYPESPETILE